MSNEPPFSAANYSLNDYIRAKKRQLELNIQMEQLFEQVDFVLAPTVGFAPPKIGQNSIVLQGQEHDLFLATTYNCAAFNLSGHPSLSIPMGLSPDRLPVGLQIVGAEVSVSLTITVSLRL